MSANRILVVVAKSIVNVVAVAGVVVAAIVATAAIAGIRPIVFLSGSMHPTIDAGALALTHPVAAGDIRPGDIISVVRQDGVRVTHRAVETTEDEGRTLLTMQGDANTAIDAEKYVVTAGADRVFWHLDGLGTLLVSLNTPWLIGGAAALLLIALIPGRRSNGARARATGAPQGVAR